ncbi:hypothetical protein SLA2020_425320 [Shorea laevis]
MDVSLIAEAVSENSALADESLVFGLKVKSASQTPVEAAHESEIASVDVRKPSSAKGLLTRGFLNPSSCAGALRCLPEPGLGCSQKLPDEQYSPSDMVLSSMLVGRDDGEDGFSNPLGVFFLPLLPWIGLFFVLRILVRWWGFRVREMRIRLLLS